MFGAKKPLANELDVSGVPELEESREFLRMWNREGGDVTCFIEPRALGPDPAGFGIAMVDAIRHGAKAFAQAVGMSEAQALARIWDGFDAERGDPTDDPRRLGGDEGLH
jgi:hypothetical protein